MNEKKFKKHLADLAHGHHRPEEHDWSTDSQVRVAPAAKKPKARGKKSAAKKTNRRAPRKRTG